LQLEYKQAAHIWAAVSLFKSSRFRQKTLVIFSHFSGLFCQKFYAGCQIFRKTLKNGATLCHGKSSGPNGDPVAARISLVQTGKIFFPMGTNLIPAPTRCFFDRVSNVCCRTACHAPVDPIFTQKGHRAFEKTKFHFLLLELGTSARRPISFAKFCALLVEQLWFWTAVMFSVKKNIALARD
jgi:hypothetical protein